MATNSLGFPATAQDWNNWKGTGDAKGNPIDPIQALSMLLSKTANPQDAQNALGPATLQQVGSAGKTSSDAIGPYQEGVAKALKELGQKHTQEAVASGVNPVDIQNHEIMQPQTHQDASQILSNLLVGTQPEQKKSEDYGYKPDNPVSAFFNMLGITPTPEAQLTLTQAALNRQRLAAGQPSEIALPQAQASGLLQEQAGQKPIQPYEAAQLRAGQNTAQITAMQDAITNLQKRRDALNAEFEQEGKTLSAVGRLGGLLTFQGQQMTPRQKAIKVEQRGIDRVLANMQAKMSGFTPENPAALKGGKNMPTPPSGATHYSPSTGKFYNAQGQEIK